MRDAVGISHTRMVLEGTSLVCLLQLLFCGIRRNAENVVVFCLFDHFDGDVCFGLREWYV